MKTNAVPPKMREWADTWIKLNPEYHYNFVDDDGCESLSGLVSLITFRLSRK